MLGLLCRVLGFLGFEGFLDGFGFTVFRFFSGEFRVWVFRVYGPESEALTLHFG